MHLFLRFALVILTCSLFGVAHAVPTTINDFFLPGSQPGQSGQLETPQRCDNCHGGYNRAVEPAFTWRGGMMSQSARDPLFWACVAIANQDAPFSGDLCIRCHSPAGWLEGRSTPTDGSALNNNDREGVQCDFCHKLVRPTPIGTNPYPSDATYTSGTYPRDQSYLSTLNPIPAQTANGMYICDANNAKRGPFSDVRARHQSFYSPFHSDIGICGTCHDVSNPVFSRDPATGRYVPNAFNAPAPDFNLRNLFPIERTYSEWSASDYNTAQGVYAPQFGGNLTYVRTCQDCHMRDVTGVGCNKTGAPVRNNLPLHDQAGGNTVVQTWVAALFPNEVDTAALRAGALRAQDMLQRAASMTLNVVPQGTGFAATVRVTNETGHKLPSGYPEGRRMWINLKAFDANNTLVYESGAYDPATGVLTHDADAKIYEIHLGISPALAPVLGLPAGPSFHFVLNDTVYFDNRIPPRGFTNASFAAIQSPPVGYNYADGQYWDETVYFLPGTTARVEATLYYQTVSKEYVEFLRDANVTNNAGVELYNLWSSSGKSAPVVMQHRVFRIGGAPDTTPPSAPTDLVARAQSDSRIVLSWTASTDNVGVTGYRIYRTNIHIATTTTTTYADTGLKARTTYSYYVKAFDAAGNLSSPSNTASATTLKRTSGGALAANDAVEVPGGVIVSPNPFNAVASIRFSVTEAGLVRLVVYNLMGQQVATLVDQHLSEGRHQVVFDARNLPSGVYVYRLEAPGISMQQKALLLR